MSSSAWQSSRYVSFYRYCKPAFGTWLAQGRPEDLTALASPRSIPFELSWAPQYTATSSCVRIELCNSDPFDVTPRCREQVRESEQQVAAGRPFQAYLHGAPKPPCQAERWQTLQDIYKTQGGMVITDPDISASLFREQALRTPLLACVLHECSPLVLNAAHAAALLVERRCMVLTQNQHLCVQTTC